MSLSLLMFTMPLENYSHRHIDIPHIAIFTQEKIALTVQEWISRPEFIRCQYFVSYIFFFLSSHPHCSFVLRMSSSLCLSFPPSLSLPLSLTTHFSLSSLSTDSITSNLSVLFWSYLRCPLYLSYPSLPPAESLPHYSVKRCGDHRLIIPYMPDILIPRIKYSPLSPPAPHSAQPNPPYHVHFPV